MKINLFILIIILAISCTKEIEIQIPNQTAKLVVNSTILPYSFFNTKQLSVKLSETKHIFDSTNANIDNAIVLYYENNILKDTLNYVDSLQLYNCSEANKYPTVGNKYSIRIEKEGHEVITANTTIPSKIYITDTVITPIVFFDETGSVSSEIALTFTDPANEENYYELAVSDIAFEYGKPDKFYEFHNIRKLLSKRD